MGSGGGARVRRCLVVVALVAIAGCSASTTVAVDGPATPRPTLAVVEPTAVEPVPTPTDAATPVPAPTVEAPGPAMRGDALLGISHDGRYGYAGVRNPWADEAPCDSAPEPLLVGLDLAASTRDDQLTFDAGVVQVGAIRQLVFGDGPRLAAVLACGPFEATELRLLPVDLDDGGRAARVGEPIVLSAAPGESEPWLLRWADDDHVVVQVTVEVDPDDYETWLLERRTISTIDGEIVAVEQGSWIDGYGRSSLPVFRSPQGFVYREVDDPNGALGCEGVDVAATIEVDDGSGFRLAMGIDGPVASTIDDMHFGPGGLVAWTSGCEGYTTPWVGRIVEDGTIVDAHFVDLYTVESPADPNEYTEYPHVRLADDGHLVALGTAYDADNNPTVKILRYDLAEDPDFVETADPPIFIDTANPLATTLSGRGSWYVGESRADSPGCGDSTLYAETTTGFVRVLRDGSPIDTVVDIEVGETRTVSFEDGYSYRTRALVLATACPTEYDGVRLWFGDEDANVRYGLYLQQADVGEVAELLSVREVVAPGESFRDALFAEVVLFDGTVTEVELVAVPFES